MITLEEIKKEVENLSEILKQVKTVEDCRNLRRYGFDEEYIHFTTNGEDWNLKDAVMKMKNWETIKVQSVAVFDCNINKGIFFLSIDENGKISFDIVDNEYDEEYSMIEDATLDTLEEKYKQAIDALERDV